MACEDGCRVEVRRLAPRLRRSARIQDPERKAESWKERDVEENLHLLWDHLVGDEQEAEVGVELDRQDAALLH